MIRSVLVGLLILCQTNTIQDPTRAFPGEFSSSPTGWSDLHESYVRIARQGDAKVVFLGDSLTQNWSKQGKAEWDKRFLTLRAVNFGIISDKTNQLLWRIENGTLEGLGPKLIVIAIGINNIWKEDTSPGKIAEGVLACARAAKAKCPESKLLLIGLFPVREKPNHPFRDNVAKVNQNIRVQAAEAGIRMIDIGNTFLDASGVISRKIMPDFVHLSEAGYKRYADAIEPTIREMLK